MGGLELPNEVNHGPVDLPGPFLLGPVTAAWQEEGSPKLRYKLGQVGDDLVHPTKSQNEIAVPGDVQGWDLHLASSHGCQELPIAVDVAIPVQPTAKSRAQELAHIEVHVPLA